MTSKRKTGLIEHDMTGNNDSIGGEVKTAIPFVIGGETKEHTTNRARGKLMGSGGGCVGVTKATENTKVLIRGRRAEESLVWGGTG